MTVGILGSGFGLYGYLPALASLGAAVVMPERYRDKLRGRPDVRALDTRVEWVADDEAVLARASALVVTRRPADQVRAVRAALDHGKAGRFVLEKPLGPDPAAALALFDALERSGKGLRLGFIFSYAAWARALRTWVAAAGESAALAIDWRFRAHHYAVGHETWKRRPSQGGGALRFYGIHLIALLAELGYSEVTASRVAASGDDEAEAWRATVVGAGRPPCRLLVDSDAGESTFQVTGTGSSAGGAPSIALCDPFDGVPLHGDLDRRVDALRRLCGSLLDEKSPPAPAWYRASLELWAAAERQFPAALAPVSVAGSHAPPD